MVLMPRRARRVMTMMTTGGRGGGFDGFGRFDSFGLLLGAAIRRRDGNAWWKCGGDYMHASLVIVCSIVGTSFLPAGEALPRETFDVHVLISSSSMNFVSLKCGTSQILDTHWLETIPTCLPAVTQKNSPRISGFTRSVGWGVRPVRDDMLGL